MAKIQANIGLKSLRVPRYASEPGFVAAVRAQTAAMTAALLDILQQFEDVAPEIIADALVPTMEQAKAYTPVRTGALRNSAYIEKVAKRGAVVVEFGFAKGGVPRYAAYVHEMVEQPHEEPTQAKFLQKAVMEDLDGIYERIGAGYKAAMS